MLALPELGKVLEVTSVNVLWMVMRLFDVVLFHCPSSGVKIVPACRLVLPQCALWPHHLLVHQQHPQHRPAGGISSLHELAGSYGASDRSVMHGIILWPAV